MFSYDALIKRAEKAIAVATNKESPAAVHKVTNHDDISKLSGLVVILHNDYVNNKKDTLSPC